MSVSKQWLIQQRSHEIAGQHTDYQRSTYYEPLESRTSCQYSEIRGIRLQMEKHKKEMAEKEAALKAEIEESRAMLRDFMEFAQMGKEASVLDSLPDPTPWQESMTATSSLEPSSV